MRPSRSSSCWRESPTVSRNEASRKVRQPPSTQEVAAGADVGSAREPSRRDCESSRGLGGCADRESREAVSGNRLPNQGHLLPALRPRTSTNSMTGTAQRYSPGRRFPVLSGAADLGGNFAGVACSLFIGPSRADSSWGSRPRTTETGAFSTSIPGSTPWPSMVRSPLALAGADSGTEMTPPSTRGPRLDIPTTPPPDLLPMSGPSPASLNMHGKMLPSLGDRASRMAAMGPMKMSSGSVLARSLVRAKFTPSSLRRRRSISTVSLRSFREQIRTTLFFRAASPGGSSGPSGTCRRAAGPLLRRASQSPRDFRVAAPVPL